MAFIWHVYEGFVVTAFIAVCAMAGAAAAQVLLSAARSL
jgi:hypothetical protein